MMINSVLKADIICSTVHVSLAVHSRLETNTWKRHTRVWSYLRCLRSTRSGVYITVGCPSVRLSVCPRDRQQCRPAGLLLSVGVCSRYGSIAAGAVQPVLWAPALSSKCWWSRHVKSRRRRLTADLLETRESNETTAQARFCCLSLVIDDIARVCLADGEK